MFEGAISFAHVTLSLWDTSHVMDMSSMFEGAISFAEPLNSWIGSAATNSSRSASIFASATAFLNKYSCYSAVDGPVDTCVCANPDFCVTDASFLSSVSACLAESPLLGLCPTFGTITTKLGASISTWDTSKVTNMDKAFENATSFNGDISSWDTSGVTSMSFMFFNASSFDGDILEWSGSATETAQFDMFFGASQFHRKFICDDVAHGPLSACYAQEKLTDATISGAIGSCLSEAPATGDCTKYGTVDNKYGVMSYWDVSLVTDMQSAFQSKSTFNGDISKWDVSSVKDMSHMFRGANAFTGDLSSWRTSSLTRMYRLLYDSHANPDLSNWDVSKVTNMERVFDHCDSFNQDISSWDVSSVTNMHYMFSHARKFNGELNDWDTSNVRNMYYMFHYAYDFNQDLDKWDTSSVTDMHYMFEYAHDFNGTVGTWDVSQDDHALHVPVLLRFQPEYLEVGHIESYGHESHVLRCSFICSGLIGLDGKRRRKLSKRNVPWSYCVPIEVFLSGRKSRTTDVVSV